MEAKNQVGIGLLYRYARDGILFQGTDSVSLCSLAGRYDNPIPARFQAPSPHRLFKNSSSLNSIQILYCTCMLGYNDFDLFLQNVASQIGNTETDVNWDSETD
jgi:hypothetical protein